VALFGVVEAQLGWLMPCTVDIHPHHSLFWYLVKVNIFSEYAVYGVSD